MKQNVMNPSTWNMEQINDFFRGMLLTTVVIAEALLVVIIFS